MSLLSTLTFGQATRYHKRIERIDLPGRVSFEEFVAFQRFTAKSDIIKMKIATWRFLNFEMMRELCDDFSAQDEEGGKISDIQIHTFIKVLDMDDSGELDFEEVVGVLDGRKNIGQGKEQEFKNELVEMLKGYQKKLRRLVGV